MLSPLARGEWGRAWPPRWLRTGPSSIASSPSVTRWLGLPDAGRRLPGREPGPDFACQVAEECRRRLEVLDDPQLRDVARWKMEGYTNHEIARKLGCVETTVERKLRVIRSIWAGEDVP